MVIAVSMLDVINRGLDFVGEDPITTENPETNPGKIAVRHFPHVRREVLRVHPWNFAVARQLITKVAAPPFDYSDAYEWPETAVRLLELNGRDRTELDYDLGFDIVNQQRVILINNGGADTLKMKYVYDLELLHLWDPLALKVFAMWLALDISYSVSGKAEMALRLKELLKVELQDATGVDGQERPPISESRFRTEEARLTTFDDWPHNMADAIVPP